MNNFKTIAKKRILASRTESLLIVILIAFAASVLFSAFSLGAGFAEYFSANAERLTGNTLSQVLANAKTNIADMGDYMYEFYEFFMYGYVEPKDCIGTHPIPLAENAESLFSAHAMVENLPLTIALMSSAILITVYISVSIVFGVCKRERRSFYATLLASGATKKQIKKCAFYEAVYYCAVAVPAGIVLCIAELFAVKFAAKNVFGKALSDVGAEPFDVKPGLILAVIAVASVFVFFLVWCFSAAACKKISVKTVAAEVKRSFVTSIGDRVLTETSRKYKLLGIEYFIAFRNFHNNLVKYLKIILMTVMYVVIICSSLMMFTAIRGFMSYEAETVKSSLIDFSYASEIYMCAVSVLIAVVTVISTFIAVSANVNSNVGEYALMRSAGSSTKSVLRTVRIEGYVCNAFGVFFSGMFVLVFYAFITQIYQYDGRVHFGTPEIMLTFFFAAMLLFCVSVIFTSVIAERKMKKIDVIGVLKEFIY